MQPISGSRRVDLANDLGRATRWLNIGITFLVISVYIYTFSCTVADPDLWGHVKFGHDTVKAGSVIRSDPYSYLSVEGTWINHELLAEVVMWLAYSSMGSTGLVLLKLVVSISTLAILFLHLRHCGIGVTAAGALLMMIAPALTPHLAPVRPQLFTLLFFASTMIVLVSADRGKSHVMWLLVPIFALWINFHGGVLAGLGIVALWLVIRLLQLVSEKKQTDSSRLRSALRLTVPAVVAACATLVTPYGPDGLLFLLRTATVARPEIRDWQALNIVSPLGVAYLIVLAATLAGLLYSRRDRSPALVAVYACMALLPFVAIRHLPLFAIAAIVVAGEHVYDAWNRRSTITKKTSSTMSAAWLRPALAGLSGIIAVVMLVLSIKNMSDIWITKGDYPTRAIALLRTSVPAANLAIHFDWGQYAIWHLGPEIQVSLDGRRETVYSDSIYKENLHFMIGHLDWDRLIDDHPTDLALVKKEDAAYNLMKLKPGWVMVYEDPMCALFLPENSPLRRRIEAATVPDVPYDGEGMSFP